MIVWGSASHWIIWLLGCAAVWVFSEIHSAAQKKNKALYVAVLAAHIGLALILATTFPYQWGKSDENCKTEYDRAGSYTVCE